MSLAVANRPEPSRAATQTAAGHPPSRYDRAWMAMMSATDAVLRRVYGVQTFNDHPDCFLRIARGTAPHDLWLSDGTAVHVGDPVAMLHFWNEHMPPFKPGGPDLAWAHLFRYRMIFSLQALADYLRSTHAWDDVQAIHGCVNFGNRRRRWQIRLAAARFGLELVPVEPRSGLHERGEDMLIWGFARAFNPMSLRRHVLWRDRTELWVSRASLLRQYE